MTKNLNLSEFYLFGASQCVERVIGTKIVGSCDETQNIMLFETQFTDLSRKYRTVHPATKKYTQFLGTHEAFTKIDICWHKANLNRLYRTEVTQNRRIKLETLRRILEDVHCL